MCRIGVLGEILTMLEWTSMDSHRAGIPHFISKSRALYLFPNLQECCRKYGRAGTEGGREVSSDNVVCSACARGMNSSGQSLAPLWGLGCRNHQTKLLPTAGISFVERSLDVRMWGLALRLAAFQGNGKAQMHPFLCLIHSCCSPELMQSCLG